MAASAAPPLPSPASPAGLLDSLAFPLRGAALAAVVTLAVLRVGAGFIPLVGLFFNLVCLLALYRYALEVLAATGSGRHEPPEVVAHVDDRTHRGHVVVQLVVMAVLLAVLWLLPGWRWLAALAAALALPGITLALSVAQNLIAALNPLNWLVVARRLGVGYAGLVAGWWPLLLFMVGGKDWLAVLPGPLGALLFYLLAHALLLALFRWHGLFLRRHGRALGFEADLARRPTLAREREREQLDREVRVARGLADPAARAARLQEAARRGHDEQVQHDYREALRAHGDRAALLAHAQVRCSELLALGRVDDARPLVEESLQDDPSFCLDDAGLLAHLLDRLQQQAGWENAARLADNYCERHPRRRDSVELAIRAAHLFADRLAEPARARHRLERALQQFPEDAVAAELRRLLTRLQHGIPLSRL